MTIPDETRTGNGVRPPPKLRYPSSQAESGRIVMVFSKKDLPAEMRRLVS